MQRAIVHVDMDAFYASVEQRDRPELKRKPLIVGGHPTRGVVLAASYEVRPYGVRSAMPMSRAVRLAPDAIVVPPRPEAYARASEQVFEIFESVTPLVEPLSLDEAFLDVTGSVKLLGSPWSIAAAVRARIARELLLPSSAGIATTKYLAKLASDLAKPDGQKEIGPDHITTVLWPLGVGRLWGVGPKSEETLSRLGLKTIGQIAHKDVAWLEQRLGKLGRHVWELSQGIDPRPVIPDRDAKSIGAEDTFEEDLCGLPALLPHLHSQATRVGRRLRRAGVRARVVQLKLKFADFSVTTRRTTLDEPTHDGQTLYRVAERLLGRTDVDRAVRLTGVSAHELGASPQLDLFAAPPSRADRLNEALDRINERFGGRTIATADLAAEDHGDDSEESRRRARASKTDLGSRQPR